MLRVLNIDGALTSYQSFLVKGSTLQMQNNPKYYTENTYKRQTTRQITSIISNLVAFKLSFSYMQISGSFLLAVAKMHLPIVCHCSDICIFQKC